MREDSLCVAATSTALSLAVVITTTQGSLEKKSYKYKTCGGGFLNPCGLTAFADARAGEK